MKPVREVVTREIIDDLWGAGYTILPRNRNPDPFHVPLEMVPATRSYQWMHLVYDREQYLYPGSGWSPVPASRHDGYFMPAGHVGDIEVSGLGLFEKPKFEVDAERQTSIQKAQDAADPAKFFAGKGFSGSVTVGHQIGLGKTAEYDVTRTVEIGGTKTVEDATAIPRDMVPYIAQIFEERDRIWNVDSWDELSPAEAKSMAMLRAIEIVRNRIKQEASNGD